MSEEDSSSSDNDGPCTGLEVRCTLCKKKFNNSVLFRQHLKSNKHIKAEKEELLKDKYLLSYRKAVTEKNDVDPKDTKKQGSSTQSAKQKDTKTYTCEVCNKKCSGITNFQAHLDGKSHAKELNKQKVIALLKGNVVDSEASNIVVDKDREELYAKCPKLKPYGTCQQCNKSFTGPEAYMEHMESNSHKKMIEQLAVVEALEKDIKIEKLSATSSDDLNKTPLTTCKECNKIFYDIIPYRQHLVSEQHKKRLKKLRLAEKVVKQMVAENSEGQQFQCATCAKIYSDPKSYYKHLSESSHPEQEEKEHILKDLLSKFPDLLKDTSDNSDTESDEKNVLFCGVCSKTFSSEISAADHFLSKNHQKAVKEKQRIEKILQKQKAKRSKDNIAQPAAVQARQQSTKLSVSSDDFEVLT